MRPFKLTTADGIDEALSQFDPRSAYLAGGTTLVDLMKLEVATPEQVVDLNALPLRDVSVDDTGVRIGALARMSEVAADPAIVSSYPMIVQSLAQSASPQLRAMASIGGNLLQRTRCGYFRDTATPCNKREPGTGCPAIGGENRAHAVLGTSDSCVATHASDLAVALVALDAAVQLRSGNGERSVRLADFYRLPQNTPHLENTLQPGELITAVTVPALTWAKRSVYLKIRDRAGYEFALTSAAVAVDLDGETIADARVAVGGVGTVPWRLPKVEAALRGRPMQLQTYTSAAELATDGARPLSRNAFKIPLLRRTIIRALLSLGE
jgi:xanthine dehydrogenase YagS FAD-binding subunit